MNGWLWVGVGLLVWFAASLVIGVVAGKWMARRDRGGF